MMLVMALVAQVLVEQPAPAKRVGPILPQATRLTKACLPSDGEEIVICGKPDGDQYRLRPLGPPPNGKPLPPMTARLGNGTIDGRAQERCVGGFCAPAAMVTLKLPF